VGGFEDLIALLGGPFVLATIYGWLRWTRGPAMGRLPDEPEIHVVTTLAVMDALGHGEAEVTLDHLANAVLTSRYVVDGPGPIEMKPYGPDVTQGPTWSQGTLALLGKAASVAHQSSGSMLAATLDELQRCDAPQVVEKMAGAHCLPSPILPPEVDEPAVILHNDDKTTMDAVIELLTKHAGHNLRQATYVMLVVHHHGSAPVADYRRGATRQLAHALELGAFDLEMQRIRITVEPRSTAA